MKKIDEYWLALTKAILNDQDNLHYLYDKCKNIILIIQNPFENPTPYYINETLKNFDKDYENKIMPIFTEVLNKYISKSNDILRLESINFEVKESFLSQYFDSIPNNIDYKLKIINELKIDNINQGSIIISKINYNESWNYAKIFGKFFREKFELFYFPKGILEKTDIVW